MGNIHASKKEIQIYSQKIIPAGFIIYKKLKDKLFSILLIAKSGEIFNNELKKIEFHEDDSFEKNFDFVIKIDKVTPCSFLENL